MLRKDFTPEIGRIGVHLGALTPNHRIVTPDSTEMDFNVRPPLGRSLLMTRRSRVLQNVSTQMRSGKCRFQYRIAYSMRFSPQASVRVAGCGLSGLSAH